MHGLDLTMPRRCARQVHRPNVGGSIEEYLRRTIYVPVHGFLDPVSGKDALVKATRHIFTFSQQTERDEFKHIVSSVNEMYGIDNLIVEETLAWYDV